MSDHIISTRRQRVSGGAATICQAMQGGGGERPPESSRDECPHRAGLRVLARMIVQHAVAHPEMFGALPPDDPVPPLFPVSRASDVDARAGNVP